jgi:HSP20 family protein
MQMANLSLRRGNQGSISTRRQQNPLDQLRHEFDRIFDRAFGGWMMPLNQDMADMRVWDFDVREDDKEIVVRAEMPGFESNEVDVQLNNDTLTIKAEKQEKSEGEEEYRSFFRSVTLPTNVDADKAQAVFRNGVLELHLPKTEQAKAKSIRIQNSNGQQQQTQQGKQAQTSQKPKM